MLRFCVLLHSVAQALGGCSDSIYCLHACQAFIMHFARTAVRALHGRRTPTSSRP